MIHGSTCLVLEASRKSCHLRRQPCVQIDYVGDSHADKVVALSTGMAFVTKMSEKCKFTLSSAIQANICERPLVLKRN
jgi:hypothetical protein